MDELIHCICKSHNISLIDIALDSSYVNRVNMPLETFYERSFNIYNQIILGIYVNKEMKMASFFHELGHILSNDNYENKYEQEKDAWNKGFELASQYNIKFSEEIMIWSHKQLETHKKHA